MQSHPASRRVTRGAHTLALSLILTLALTPLIETADAAQTPTPTLATVQNKLASMAVPWVPNAGQWDARATFRAQSFAGAVWVTADGKLVHQFNGARANVSADLVALSGRPDARPSARLPKSGRGDVSSVRGEPVEPRSPGWVLTERFVGGAIKQTPRGSDPHIGRVSFMTSDTLAQADNLPSYGQVELGEVFPGVSVALKATNANVEKLFTVAPGRDPSVIRMAVDGAERLSIGSDGSLIATTGNGDIAFTAPIAFQEIDGVRKDVPVTYSLDATQHRYGFVVSGYDSTHPLVIDPLLQSTYLGGSGNEFTQAIAVHPWTGDVYVAGSTPSANFPGVAGGAQSSLNGATRIAFITRFNATLNSRLQSTFLGGGVSAGTISEALALAIHPASGEVYVAGTTNFPGFPGVSGSAQPAISFDRDSFVARLNATLTTLHQASFNGGSGTDEAHALAIHPMSGEIYVAGRTSSTDFPGTTVGLGGAAPGAQSSLNGTGDAFVTRFNAALTSRLQSTYLGGSGVERANALAIHPLSGGVYIAGVTTSSNLPGVTPASGGAGTGAQSSKGDNTGFPDAFVTRFNAALTVLLQSSYLGGDNEDAATAIAIQPTSGEVYVAGISSSSMLPNTANGAQPAQASTSSFFRDAFIARFNDTLTSNPSTTFLGGADSDLGNALALHPQTGEIYVAGGAFSSNFPGLANGAQTSDSGGGGFVTRLNATLSRILQSTYLGGGLYDEILVIALHPATGDVVVAGDTDSNIFPGTSVASPQPSYGGNTDGFVSRLTADLTAVNRRIDPIAFMHQSGVSPSSTRTSNEVQLVITPNPGNNQQTAYVTGAASSEFCVTNTEGCCTTPLLTCSGFRTGWLPATNPPYNFLSGDRVAVRHTSAFPGGTVETKLIVSGVAYPFRSSTGNANIACNLDMNGDNVYSHTVEGLILIRAMLGFGADAIVAGTGVFPWDPVRLRLNEFCGTNFPFSPSAFQ